MLSFCVRLFGQALSFKDIPQNLLESFGEMGVCDSLFLNHQESMYLNVIFKNSRDSFDFTEKKVGFITGSTGRTKSNKVEYFKLEKERFYRNYTPNGGTLYIFNEAQKEESGGYDAAIVYWCKINLSEDIVIKRLSKRSSK